MPETAAASSSTKNRPGPSKQQQYRCNICNKPFDCTETLDCHRKFERSEPGHCKPVAGVG